MNSEKISKHILLITSFIIILIAIGMVFTLARGAMPIFEKFGLRFIFSSAWDPTTGRENYGALPVIVGPLSTSILALAPSLPLPFSTSLFVGQYFTGTLIATVLGTLVDFLAGIPSTVYGLWGFHVLRPFIVQMGWNEQGYGIFTSGLILAIMIIPYATSISTEIISLVPNHLKEAAYSLGATRMEVVFNVTVPAARSGIVASYILAFGRAVGETMAVTMLIGNKNAIPHGIFDIGNTMASVIANQFGEADGLKLSALIAIGLLLFIITGIVNYLGKLVIKQFS